MEYETLIFETDNRIATITLNRPDSANALDVTMARELVDVSIRCDESSDIRAVIIRGAGKLFCAGGDLSVFAEAGDHCVATGRRNCRPSHCNTHPVQRPTLGYRLLRGEFRPVLGFRGAA